MQSHGSLVGYLLEQTFIKWRIWAVHNSLCHKVISCNSSVYLTFTPNTKQKTPNKTWSSRQLRKTCAAETLETYNMGDLVCFKWWYPNVSQTHWKYKCIASVLTFLTNRKSAIIFYGQYHKKLILPPATSE